MIDAKNQVILNPLMHFLYSISFAKDIKRQFTLTASLPPSRQIHTPQLVTGSIPRSHTRMHSLTWEAYRHAIRALPTCSSGYLLPREFLALAHDQFLESDEGREGKAFIEIV